MQNARVLTFHIDPETRPELDAALAEATRHLAECPGFGGLLCLAHDGTRQQIVVITLWDGEGMAATAAEHERTRQHIAATTDLGVTSRTDSVVMLVPGRVDPAEVVQHLMAR